MKKNGIYYFKRALILTLPIAVFVIVRDLFEAGISDTSALMNSLIKGFTVGVITSIVFGIINIFAKVETIKKKE